MAATLSIYTGNVIIGVIFIIVEYLILIFNVYYLILCLRSDTDWLGHDWKNNLR